MMVTLWLVEFLTGIISGVFASLVEEVQNGVISAILGWLGTPEAA